jgi:hypothetical protein
VERWSVRLRASAARRAAPVWERRGPFLPTAGDRFWDRGFRAKSYRRNLREFAPRLRRWPASENPLHAGAGRGLPWVCSRKQTTENLAGGRLPETRAGAVARSKKYIPGEGQCQAAVRPRKPPQYRDILGFAAQKSEPAIKLFWRAFAGSSIEARASVPCAPDYCGVSLK